MKRRTAYANFERTILSLYEQKMLTVNLLDRIANKYRWVGIDSAGSQYVQAQDSKDLHQICIALVDPNFPIAMRGSRADHEETWEKELKKWEEIVYKRWGWQAYCAAFPIQNQRNNAA